jgi:pyruvate decarboxylase
MSEQQPSTVGRYLAARLAEIGIRHYFAVPGDYNLVLLDELLTEDRLQLVGCCNELNAGYAADGYARATGGPSAAVVTYSVGALSLVNAVAGAYAEDLPLIAVSGGPNSNSTADYELLHHTLGKVDYDYVRDMYTHVTTASVIVMHPSTAAAQIDDAIETALVTRKPVYIEIASNVASAPISPPLPRRFAGPPASDPDSLAVAVDAAAELLDAALKPVLVAGVKLRPYGAEAAFATLADACGYGVAAMPNAKAMFDESHPSYMGIYWGPVGWQGCADIVESADVALYAGATFTDYSTTGHTSAVDPSKMILVNPDHVVLPHRTFTDVALGDFLAALAPKLTSNPTSLEAYGRVRRPAGDPPGPRPDEKVTTAALFGRVRELVDGDTTLIAETGDSWFNCINMPLPSGVRFEIQMQYGSIGWSVGATLGVCLGDSERRVIAMIGDGSFQLTAQELSTMIRSGARPLIFLINNGGYTIEVEIHDGPYNRIKNWDYAGLMAVFSAGDGNGLGLRATTVGELDDAIARAEGHDGPVMIEVVIDRDDCSGELLAWGAHVAKNNGRPPHRAF